MLLKTIGTLIDRTLQKAPVYARLDRLETDVLNKIHSQQLTPFNLSFLSILPSPQQLGYASLVLFVVSVFSLSQISLQPTPHKYTLGLEVFSPQSPLFLTSMTDNKGDTLS